MTVMSRPAGRLGASARRVHAASFSDARRPVPCLGPARRQFLPVSPPPPRFSAVPPVLPAPRVSAVPPVSPPPRVSLSLPVSPPPPMSLPPPMPARTGPRLCTPPDSAHTVSRVDDEAQLHLSCQKSSRSGCQDATAAPADLAIAEFAPRRGLTADRARGPGTESPARRAGSARDGRPGRAGRAGGINYNTLALRT